MTPKEQIFVDRYLIHWNGSRAVREAGFETEYEAQHAYELLRKPYIREVIKARLSEYTMETDEILSRFAAMARGEIPTKVYDGKEEYNTAKALEDLAKVHAMFVDKQQIEIEGMEIIYGEAED